jgi:hypothetical protein
MIVNDDGKKRRYVLSRVLATFFEWQSPVRRSNWNFGTRRMSAANVSTVAFIQE